ncbi:hypothetical protein EWM64_g4272 [Hericium alpestre]|uniref:Cytochrome P450 n=1 Tax=Hericium alpestre TaxID=135208 RepID=A0A4Y9ZZ11_9AGAM|nr:hypothetical protein EWM64_g4272 [Hericium alpestre]
MDNLFVSPYPAVGVLLCTYFVFRWIQAHKSDLNTIPTIGYAAPLLSYITASRWAFDSRSMLQEGYEKYKGGLFKLAHMNYWTVVVTSPDLVDDSFQTKYTIGMELTNNPFHIPVVRSRLTRNLTAVFPQIRDELVAGSLDLIPAKENGMLLVSLSAVWFDVLIAWLAEWVGVPVRAAIMEIIARTSNRIFVGLPLCREPEWLKLNMEYTVDVVKGAHVLSPFPELIKPLLARMILTNLEGSVETGLKHLKPIIEDRRRKLDLYGDNWENKPAFTHVLYLLAAHPEYVQPLRDEVESIIAVEGWTKAAIGKMFKVDSFIREATRINGLNLTVMNRWVNKPFKFSNGVTVPAGVMISCAAAPIHRDDEFYPDGDTFNPFRFADIREGDGESLKHQMSTTTNQYLAFGQGRHACPGRFFATNELKCLLAHVVTAYDVKLEDGAREVPPNIVIGNNIVPADANVLFRKRSAANTVVG